ncbi:TonB family protein [Neptunicella sp. SCSIO 80796]|uniref:energy transducer TonB n=1 Tax=Neptunicella plasticusilytica TaxID=3117012 RepID=UPI003A4E4424
MHTSSISHIDLRFVSKALSITLVASSVTFVLFLLMQYLIKTDAEIPADSKPYVFIDPVFAKQDTPEIVRKVLPQPPKMTEQPQTNRLQEATNNLDPGTLAINTQFHVETVKAATIGDFSVQDAEAKPVFRVQPKYPIEAARKGITGWVQLSFDINATGGVENVSVIDSEPRRVFDTEARRALQRWKYKPQITDGVAQTQYNQRVMLSFNLEE